MIRTSFCSDAAVFRGFTVPVKTKKIHQSRSFENFFKSPHKISGSQFKRYFWFQKQNTLIQLQELLDQGLLLHFVMLTPLLTNQSLKNRNIEHLIKTTADRLGKLITDRKKGLFVVQEKNSNVPWKHPAICKPGRLSE